jgi:putative endonuclease
MTMRRTRNEIGATGETLAALELESQGMEILDRNWSCRWGELDVVALDCSEGRRTAVFCEVKCRTGRGYGDTLESITFAKVRRLRQLSAEWLRQHSGLSIDAIRLDAIGVLLQRDQQPVLVHITGIGDQ